MTLYQPCKIYSICHASSSSTILLLLPCQDPHTAQCKHKPITNGYKVLPTKHLTAWSSSLLHSCSTKVKQYHLHLFMDTYTGKTQQHAKNILHLVQWKSTLKKTMTFFLHPLMCGRAFHFFWCVAAFHLLLEKQTKNKLYVMLTRNPIGDFLFKKLYYSLFCVLTSTVYFSVMDAGVDRGYTMRQALKITFNSSSI